MMEAKQVVDCDVCSHPHPAMPANPLPCGCGVMAVQDIGDCSRGTDVIPWKHFHVVHCPLHSAAPELLAACQPIVEWADKYNPEEDPTVVVEMTRDEYNALRAAMAKATGQEKATA